MIKKCVLVVWSPNRAGDIIDFDLYHLLDAVDDARHAHLLFWYGRWTSLWLLWHLRSPLIAPLFGRGNKTMSSLQLSLPPAPLRRRADKFRSGRNFLCTPHAPVPASDSGSSSDRLKWS